ncbi:hypothetical protein Tco_0380986 [Tanacetum coccineum]
MEDEFYNLDVKGNDLKTYVRRFHEGNVTASKPQTLEEAITITQRLMEQVIKHNSAQETNDHKRKFEDRRNTTDNNNYPNDRNNNNHSNNHNNDNYQNNHNNHNCNNDYHQQQNRRQETIRTYAATPTENKRSLHCQVSDLQQSGSSDQGLQKLRTSISKPSLHHSTKSQDEISCMTRSSTSELFTPYKEPEQEFQSSRRYFKILSLDELRLPNFNIFSDEEYSKEEVTKTMAETMEQYMSKTRADHGSGVARPKIEDKDKFKLKGQFLKELHTNTFSVWIMKMRTNTFRKVRSTKTSDGLAAIQAQLNNLGREIKKVNEIFYAAQVGCEQCKGPHYTKDFPLKEDGKTLEETYYTQFGGPFHGGGYRATTPGYY